jgi:isocitrate/isopropylmalate dehydrogenase
MMFEYLGWQAEADAIARAVRAALKEGKTPAELGGTLGTREVGDWVANSISNSGVSR